MEHKYAQTLIEYLRLKEDKVPNSRWIIPTIQVLNSNAGLLEAIIHEAQGGSFSHQSTAGEKLQTELMKITRGFGNRGRSARVFVKEYLSKYLREYLVEH